MSMNVELYLSYDTNISLKSLFQHTLYKKHDFDHIYAMLLCPSLHNVTKTCNLILKHAVSLLDATAYDKLFFNLHLHVV